VLRACGIGVALAFSGLSPAVAQDQEGVRLGITYQPGYVPALVVAPIKSDPALQAVALEAADILRTDLDYSDRFEIIPVPDSMRSDGPPNYQLWNQLGAVWLVTADVTGSATAPILRVGLHDVVYGDLKNVQAFSLPDPGSVDFRMAIHRASDAIVSWATDGGKGIAATRIAYARRGEDGSSALWIVDSDGENPRRIETGAFSVYSPAFSPDATRIAYAIQDEQGNYAILETNLITGRRRTVATSAGLIQTPTYTPDGRLAYARTVGTGRVQVFIDGGSQLTQGAGDALNPTFSPDGRMFAYLSDQTNEPQVYVQSVSGGSSRRISVYVRDERTNAASPDWSPLGDRIAYAAFSRGVFQIFTVNPDGSDRRALTTRGINEAPSWGPDGRHLVFESSDRNGYALWIMDTVTGRARTLTSGRMDQLPAWSTNLAPGS
jgi:TolB protein